jgi:hypothetical protein
MSCPLCKNDHDTSRTEALEELARTSAKLRRLTTGKTPKHVSAAPAPGKWSAKEVICHLADGELVYGMRYRKILAEPGASLVAFDQDAWAEGLRYAGQRLPVVLDSFEALRTHNLAILQGLSEDSWGRSGVHPEYGALTLGDLVIHLAAHDRKHIAQIERILGGPTPKKTSSARKAPRKSRSGRRPRR